MAAGTAGLLFSAIQRLLAWLIHNQEHHAPKTGKLKTMRYGKVTVTVSH